MPRESRKSTKQELTEHGQISRIVSIMAHYNATGRSVLTVTVVTIDGKQHTFSVPLDEDAVEQLRALAGRLMSPDAGLLRELQS